MGVAIDVTGRWAVQLFHHNNTDKIFFGHFYTAEGATLVFVILYILYRAYPFLLKNGNPQIEPLGNNVAKCDSVKQLLFGLRVLETC